MSNRNLKSRRKTLRPSTTDGPGSPSWSWTRFLERLREKESSPIHPLGDSVQESDRDEATQLLKSFPPEELRFLRLFYGGENSLAEISSVMGINVHEVRALKIRCRMRFNEWKASRLQSKRDIRRNLTPEIVSLYHDLQALQAPALMRALEVFGTAPKAIAWLEEPNPALGNTSPLEALLNQESRTEMFNILGRIEHGIIS